MDRRSLPSVDQFVSALGSWPLPRSIITEVARSVIDRARGEGPDTANLEGEARRLLAVLARARLRTVINATGVILHTNLGRSPLAPEAARAAYEASVGYTNIELDVESGHRGRRGRFLLELLADLTGAEDALVVNNNAGALMLTLSAIASGREVVVSRGELIEIGGAYRLPSIIAAGGAALVEVGTTNRTRLSDYAAAVSEKTAALLKVHTSNYQVVGFTEDASLPELVALGAETGTSTVFDQGSGLIDERVKWVGGAPPAWLAGEPGVRQAVEAGADLVLFSGDKLFGGPQAGVVVGRSEIITRLARHPLARALRVDGATVAALTATASMYADGRGAEIPVWQMATASYPELKTRADQIVARVGGDRLAIEAGASVLGAGSVPGASVASPVILITGQADKIFDSLLAGDPPVLARRDAGRVIVDLRAIPSADDDRLVAALSLACRS
ncbi:MAG TPA: L-seryl-tRNA(Sec) selenium transferase [Acidimicrobiia bacterium]|nr:L-seryl-tRNA(Sec) selenium transferase [Acidimicrobiia bacterium]